MKLFGYFSFLKPFSLYETLQQDLEKVQNFKAIEKKLTQDNSILLNEYF